MPALPTLNTQKKEVNLPAHNVAGPDIARAKIGERGEATARLVKDYVRSSVEVQCR